MSQMIRFLLKMFIFGLPFIAFSLILLLSRDYVSGGHAARLQSKNIGSILYGTIRENQYRFYKAESTRFVKPSVLILGDSRALQIRKIFFNDNVKFYNAGYSAASTADMQYFLEAQDSLNIDLLVFSLSHFSFNINYEDITYPTHKDYVEPSPYIGTEFITQANYIFKSIRSKRIPINNMLNWNLIGLNAKNLNGILNDGSYYYGEILTKAKEGESANSRITNTLARIERADSRFQHGEHANPNAIFYLKQFLAYCKSRDIYVIAYAPPYAPTVHDAMRDQGNAYAYQYEMLDLVPQIFNGFGYEFYDYTDAAFLNCTDDFYIDGFHGSDVVFLRIFMDMIEQGSRLKKYCNIDGLKLYDDGRSSNISIFEVWERYNE